MRKKIKGHKIILVLWVIFLFACFVRIVPLHSQHCSIRNFAINVHSSLKCESFENINFAEKSGIRDLTCFQLIPGESQVACSWQAEPRASFYKVIVSTPEGSEMFNLTVNVAYATLTLDSYTGNAIVVSVNNASSNVELLGMSIAISPTYSYIIATRVRTLLRNNLISNFRILYAVVHVQPHARVAESYSRFLQAFLSLRIQSSAFSYFWSSLSYGLTSSRVVCS